MPAFDADTFEKDSEGLALLAAILHPSGQARADAIARGRARLDRAVSAGQAMRVLPNKSCEPTGCHAETSAH